MGLTTSPVSRLVLLLALLGVWPGPPLKVDPQAPRNSAIPKPDIKDSIHLVNVLFRRPLGPRSVRRECRSLNATEFERITSVINHAKRDRRIKPNVYDAFAYLHAHPEVNAGAHQGPGFLPFHRVLVFLFETLMRLYDPTVSLCYWDSTLEPKEMEASATWTSALFGNHKGTVRTGFAAHWLTPEGPLARDGAKEGRPFHKKDIDEVLERDTLGEISFPAGNVLHNMEETHNFVHSYVGGLMGNVLTASYDPIFWFHHTFIDCVYERFRQRQVAKGIDPMRDWPDEYGDPAHAPYAAMRLGRLRLIDGTNDFFSTHVLQCEDSFGECLTSEDCGDSMRCDSFTARCVSDTLAPSTHNIDIDSLESISFDDPINTISRFIKSPAVGFNSLFNMPQLSTLSKSVGLDLTEGV